MRVLVTGASGFLGRYVLQDLAQRQADVIAVSRQQRIGSMGKHCVTLEDPGHAEAVRHLLVRTSPDTVIHLAGVSSARDHRAMYEANVVFAANLLDAALSLHKPPRVLIAGSAAEYGPVDPASLPVGEQQVCQPNTAYGISKLAQTSHALLARVRGLPVTVARVFNPVGADMPTSLALGSFAEQIACMGPSGGILRTGDLNVVRDFMDVAQTSRLLVTLAMEHAGTVDVINVCTGQGCSLLTLTQRLIALSGLPVTLQLDASRHGNSNVRSFIGSADRLLRLGLDPLVGAHDMDGALGNLLKGARAHAAT